MPESQRGWKKMVKRLRQQMGREPTVEEVQLALDTYQVDTSQGSIVITPLAARKIKQPLGRHRKG